MERKLEKEIMDDRHQVIAYANADFSSSNNLFIEEISKKISQKLTYILDLGCGPADVPIGLAKRNALLQITAVDASAEMLNIAKEHIQKLNLTSQINLLQGSIPGLKKMVNGKPFDIIMSKDLLHHLPDPMVLWHEIKSLSRQGTLVFVMDLIRPLQENDAKKIVQTVAGAEEDILKEDFYNSLLAAFTIPEIEKQLKELDFEFGVSRIGRRHLLVEGVI